MQLPIKAVMEVGCCIEVCLHGIPADRAPKQLAPALVHPAPTLEREPLAPSATAGAVLGRPVRIDLHRHGALSIGFLLRQTVDDVRPVSGRERQKHRLPRVPAQGFRRFRREIKDGVA